VSSDRPPDPALIEAHLSIDARAVLAEWCRAEGIRSDTWTAVPALLDVFGRFAAIRRREQLRAGGLPKDDAERQAASDLGLQAPSLNRRLRRERSAAAAAGAAADRESQRDVRAARRAELKAAAAALTRARA
jgi:hypothetical protein